jgi:hypothetical protein
MYSLTTQKQNKKQIRNPFHKLSVALFTIQAGSNISWRKFGKKCKFLNFKANELYEVLNELEYISLIRIKAPMLSSLENLENYVIN